MKYLLALTISWIFTLCQAQDKETRWSPSDIIHTEYMQSVSIAPNNKMVLWSKQKPVKDKDKFVNDLYLTRLDQKKDGKFRTIQLTNSQENDFGAIFSRDNEKVYFLSSRDKGKKLWSLNLLGGEATEVHEFKNGISNLNWLNDTTLIYTSNEGKTLVEQELEDKKDDVVVVEDTINWKANRVYSFTVGDKSIERLTNNEKPIGNYASSRNGQWLVYSMTMSPHYAADAKPDPKYFLKNLNSGEEEEILNDRDFPSHNFQFTADHRGFYFLSDTASDPEWNGAGLTELYYFDIQRKDYQKVNLDWPLGIGNGIHVSGNDVLVGLANKTTYRLALYQRTTQHWTKHDIQLGEKKDHISVLAVSQDGKKMVYDYSTASTLPKYYISDFQDHEFGNETEIISLNGKLSKRNITKSEVITWEGYQGEEVTGILYYPENYQPDQRYPLILSIHGGPSGVDTDRWRERWSTYPNILAQRGSFVLKPNYHGSSNHGLKFVESIKGNYYEPEIEDITNAIDMLVDEGKIDRQRMGVMGWSNGAIIATMLTVRFPDMFLVACPGAGDVNWTSDFGTCRFGVSFDQAYFGGAPWDDVNGSFYNENYILKSPLFELEKVRTPTIIFHGSEDRAVPRDQGWEYYRALQQAGKTPVRFLWFPGQPHGLGKITHQLRKMNEELIWIDRYLFRKEQTKNDALKKDSPLAALMKRDSLQRQGSNYGTILNNTLIPELTSWQGDSLAVGVLEVTNAQFQAFQEDHTFEMGEHNHPAQVSFDRAILYVQWLSELTGKKFRLPNSAEAKTLQKIAHKNAGEENTLNYWAGYKITKDEVTELRQTLGALETTLIKPVGSHRAIKHQDIFLYDIGGNVAEYDATGKSYGYSAYDFVDPHEHKSISSEYVGLRVFLEK